MISIILLFGVMGKQCQGVANYEEIKIKHCKRGRRIVYYIFWVCKRDKSIFKYETIVGMSGFMYARDLQIDLLKILLKRGCQVRSDKSFKEETKVVLQTLLPPPFDWIKSTKCTNFAFL